LPAALRDLRPDPDAGSRPAVREVDISDVQADQFGEPVPKARLKIVWSRGFLAVAARSACCSTAVRV